MSDTTTGQPTRLAVPPRVGWWRTYRTLVRWSAEQIGAVLPFVLVVEVILAAGIIVGFGLLIPDIDTTTAQFLASGAPTVLIMVVGLVIVPMGVAQARSSGAFTYLRAQPVPRPLLLVSELTIWIALAAPSIAVCVGVAQLRFDFAYAYDWAVLVPVALLVALTAAAVGFALAVVLSPALTQIVTQVLVFFVLLFSPVTFPADRLPAWFQTVHDWLPFRPAADLVRAGLLADTYDASLRDVLVLAVWCVLGLAVAVRAVVRRA